MAILTKQHNERLREVLKLHFLNDPWMMQAALGRYMDDGLPAIKEYHGQDAMEALADLFLGYPAWDYISALSDIIEERRLDWRLK